MKKLLNVIALTLAMNFLAIAGGVAWLYQSGQIDREKITAIKQIVFPPPDNAQGAEATTQPGDADSATTRPMLQLEELLAQHAGHAPGEQVEFIQNAFDAQMAELDRTRRELNDLARQVELARQQAMRDRLALTRETSELADREALAAKLAADEGFQDSLKLYTSMQAKQVKTVFMTLDDETVRNYLQAMQPRQATKIIREFKTPDEMKRIETVMEKMRLAEEVAADAAPESAASIAP